MNSSGFVEPELAHEPACNRLAHVFSPDEQNKMSTREAGVARLCPRGEGLRGSGAGDPVVGAVEHQRRQARVAAVGRRA